MTTAGICELGPCQLCAHEDNGPCLRSRRTQRWWHLRGAPWSGALGLLPPCGSIRLRRGLYRERVAACVRAGCKPFSSLSSVQRIRVCEVECALVDFFTVLQDWPVASLHAAGRGHVCWLARPIPRAMGRLVAHQATRYYCVYHAHVCEGCRMVPPQQHTCHRGVTGVSLPALPALPGAWQHTRRQHSSAWL